MAAVPGQTNGGVHPLARLAPALYLVGIALVVHGVAQALVVGGPAAAFGSIRWRFGFMGVVFLHTPYPLLGMAIASLTAAVLRHHSMLLGLAIGQLLLTLASLGGFLLFLLDAAEVGATVPAALLGNYTITVVQTSIAGGLSVILFGAIAGATMTSYRRTRSSRRKTTFGEDALVVGRKE